MVPDRRMKQTSEIGVGICRRPSLLFRRLFARSGAGSDNRRRLRGRSSVVEQVMARHRDADGKPCLIWQLPSRLANHDDERGSTPTVGPIMLAGSPLSYWAGGHGKNPMAISAVCWAALG